MNTCKTCKWWTKSTETKDGGYRYGDDLVDPKYPHPCSNKPFPVEFEVRYCDHPRKMFAERPIDSNGFATIDASTYTAELMTAENFGCVRHSAVDTADYPDLPE